MTVVKEEGTVCQRHRSKKEIIADAIQQCWESIPDRCFDHWVESVHRWIQALLA
jgi:hypothetical protein